MKLYRIPFLAYAAITVFAACGGDSNGGGGAGPDASGGGGGGAICSAESPCPDGQFCFNGLCALGCNSNTDCADDQYCDTEFDRLCHNKNVSSCPDTPCAEGQICRDGFCSTPPVTTNCTPRPDGEDGCDKNSLCLENEDTSTACYSFPACDSRGECPVGAVGAVCNNGIVPNKAHICLTSLCQQAAHCPASWSCVKRDTDVVGSCSDGQLGGVCLSGADCQSGLDCITALPGQLGLCQPGGF